MKPRTRLMCTLFGLNVADFFLTSILIKRNGLDVEANPWMRYLFSLEPSMFSALYYKIIVFAVLVAALEFYTRYRKGRERTIQILTALNLLFLGIVIYSLWLVSL